ncbi:MAG: EVE domain-containing protein, partial [Endomicrobiia bacterium]
MIDIYNNPHWILSAKTKNFELSISFKQIWGVQDKWYPQWKALEKGDIIFFYISGIKKIVGVGKVGNKFIQRE